MAKNRRGTPRQEAEMKTLTRVVALVVALCGPAVAASEDAAWSVGIAAGRFWPDTSTNGPKKTVDPGPIGELRVGLRAPIGLAVEFAVGGFHVEGPMPAVDVSETELQVLSATWLATTLKGWHRLGSDRLRVFAGLGAAYYRFDAGLKDPPPPPTRRDESETDVGAHLVGGMEFDVTPRIGLGLEYRWQSVKASENLLGGNAAVYSAGGNAALLSLAWRY